MKRFLKTAGILLIIVLIVLAFRIYSNLKDKNPGYNANIKIFSESDLPLKAGFAAVKVTPEVPDRWTDSNNNAKYEPADGDTYTDGNGNGKFDPVWIAGFGNARAANGVHDDLWARTIVIDDSKTRIAMVVLDQIGFMNNHVIDVRNKIPEETGISYAMIISTHVHEGPDLLGLWGKSSFKSGINQEYMDFLKNKIVESIVTAVKNIRPAFIEISENLSGTGALVADSRNPQVFDNCLRLIRFTDMETGTTLGSLVSWADHPETLWGKNLMITSDFPHYLREGIEKGVFHDGNLVKPGIGGIAVYLNGAIGGLMTTDPDLAVKDPFSDKTYMTPSFEKAEAQGRQLALAALTSIETPSARIDSSGISLIVRSVVLPVSNRLYKLGLLLNIFKRDMSGWMKMRSELAVFRLGPITFATFPGEVYPEIVNGTIEAPEGRDFMIDPVETPPVRELMPGKYKFIFGLANDEIGYIIPKSQWDEKPPFTYGNSEAPYGEENSLGPETAPVLYRNLREMIGELSIR